MCNKTFVINSYCGWFRSSSQRSYCPQVECCQEWIFRWTIYKTVLLQEQRDESRLKFETILRTRLSVQGKLFSKCEIQIDVRLPTCKSCIYLWNDSNNDAEKTLLAFFAKRVLASEYTTVLRRVVLTYILMPLIHRNSRHVKKHWFSLLTVRRKKGILWKSSL